MDREMPGYLSPSRCLNLALLSLARALSSPDSFADGRETLRVAVVVDESFSTPFALNSSPPSRTRFYWSSTFH